MPGFRKIKKYKSFTLKGTVGYKLDDIIKRNVFKFSKSREIEGKIRTVTLKRDNIGDFYVCFNLEIQDKHHITTGKSVGMDFGMKTFLTLSDGIKIHAPQYYLANLAQLRSKSRELSCKKKGSNNRTRAKLNLARFHIKVSNQRRGFLFKLANKLSKKYDEVFLEDLNMKAIARIWGRKVNDLGLSSFVSLLS